MDELRLRILQAMDAVAQQKLGRDIQGHPIEQVHDIEWLARCSKQTHHDLRPALEYVQVGNAIFDEHGPNEMPTGTPQLAIGGEDTVTQKWRPEVMKQLALAKIGKIAGQHGLDMIRVAGHDISRRSRDVALDAVGALWRGIAKVVIEKVQKPVLFVSLASAEEKAQFYMI
jgi:hypothetical protein